MHRRGKSKGVLIVGQSRFAYAEDGGAAVGADALDCGFPVLERDVLGGLDLDACLALYAVCLWHILLI